MYLFDADRANSSSTTGAERPPVEVTGIDDPALREELDTVGYDRWSTYLDEYCRIAQPPFISYDCYYHMNPGQMGLETIPAPC